MPPKHPSWMKKVRKLSVPRRSEPRMTQRERLARKIAHDIFTAGNGTVAGIAMLFKDNRSLGGWSEEALAGHIAKRLPSPRPVKRVRAWMRHDADGSVTDDISTYKRFRDDVPVTITYPRPKKGTKRGQNR